MSATLSNPGASTGPQPALKPGSRPAPAKPPPAGKRRPHIVAFDMIRLIIMVFVVGVHTLSFGGGTLTVSLGAIDTIFRSPPDSACPPRSR